MNTILKTISRLLDNFILPNNEDIAEYHLVPKFDDGIIEIVFWMDGTEQEVEEEIVLECRTILSVLGSIPYKIIYKFTTEGEHFYTYS